MTRYEIEDAVDAVAHMDGAQLERATEHPEPQVREAARARVAAEAARQRCDECWHEGGRHSPRCESATGTSTCACCCRFCGGSNCAGTVRDCEGMTSVERAERMVA